MPVRSLIVFSSNLGSLHFTDFHAVVILFEIRVNTSNFKLNNSIRSSRLNKLFYRS